MATTKKPIKKAANGTTTAQTTIKPNYSNIKGSGWDTFKTPTAKDSSDYRKGFDTRIKGEELKQKSRPTSSEIRGYNEAFKRTTKAKSGASISKAKDGGKWMQKVSASIKKRGTAGKCTPITKPGCTGRAKALAKTFKKIAKKNKK